MKMLIAIAPPVACIVYSQLMTKWRVSRLSDMLSGKETLVERLFVYLTDPLILSAYIVAFASSILWVFVVERYAVSSAFAIYIGMITVCVSAGGVLFFNETMGPQKIAAIALIVVGVCIISRN